MADVKMCRGEFMKHNCLIGRGIYGWQFYCVVYLHNAGHITINPVYSNGNDVVNSDINWQNHEYGSKCLLIIDPDMLAKIVKPGADIGFIIYSNTVNPELYVDAIVKIINQGFSAYLDIAEYNKWNKRD